MVKCPEGCNNLHFIDMIREGRTVLAKKYTCHNHGVFAYVPRMITLREKFELGIRTRLPVSSQEEVKVELTQAAETDYDKRKREFHEHEKVYDVLTENPNQGYSAKEISGLTHVSRRRVKKHLTRLIMQDRVQLFDVIEKRPLKVERLTWTTYYGEEKTKHGWTTRDGEHVSLKPYDSWGRHLINPKSIKQGPTVTVINVDEKVIYYAVKQGEKVIMDKFEFDELDVFIDRNTLVVPFMLAADAVVGMRVNEEGKLFNNVRGIIQEEENEGDTISN